MTHQHGPHEHGPARRGSSAHQGQEGALVRWPGRYDLLLSWSLPDEDGGYGPMRRPGRARGPVVQWAMDTSFPLLELYGRIPALARQAVDGVELSRLTEPPAPGANTIAWLVWHLARVQDHHVADVLDADQLWTEGGWADRFGLDADPSNTGYGHSEEQAAAVRPHRPEVLVDYLEAVDRRTRAMLEDLTPADLDRIVDPRWGPTRHPGGAAGEHRRRQPATRRAGRLRTGDSPDLSSWWSLGRSLWALTVGVLVKTRSEGTLVFYSPADVHVCRLLGDALFHADHTDRDLIDHRTRTVSPLPGCPRRVAPPGTSGSPSASQHAVRAGSW